LHPYRCAIAGVSFLKPSDRSSHERQGLKPLSYSESHLKMTKVS
jgi:hypothetical protein